MPEPIRTTKIGDCNFPLGETDVKVGDASVRVKITVEGFELPTCSVEYQTPNEQGKPYVDEKCDGQDIYQLLAPAQIGYHTATVTDTSKISIPLKALCPSFAFPPQATYGSADTSSFEPEPKPTPQENYGYEEEYGPAGPLTGPSRPRSEPIEEEYGPAEPLTLSSRPRSNPIEEEYEPAEPLTLSSRPRSEPIEEEYGPAEPLTLSSRPRSEPIEEEFEPKRRVPTAPKQNRQETTFSVFFDTDKFNIDGTDERAIKDKLAVINLADPSVSNVAPDLILAGNCDERAPVEYNDTLGRNRANAVIASIREFFPELANSAKVSLVSYGETRPSGKGWDNDRRVDVTFGQTLIERGLFMLEGDVYLIDATASMQERWQQVIDFEFPANSRIYSFNSCYGVVENSLLPPNCNTPLWASALSTMANAKSGETIVILSDGEDNASGDVTYDNVTNRAIEGGIHVNTIYVGNDTAHQQLLKTLAEKTGGAYYFLVK